jgi:hypothetical protein
MLDKELDDRSACRYYVAFLKLAAEHGEEVISRHLENLLAAGTIPKPSLIEDLLPSKRPPEVNIQVDLREPQSYDQLLTI